MPEKVDLEVGLPRSNVAPLLGRWALETFVADRVASMLLTNAQLLVSELVGNALLHSQQRITLRASLDQSRLLVHVIDEGVGLESRGHRTDDDELGGCSLDLVQHIASRWGVDEPTTVWFELTLP